MKLNILIVAPIIFATCFCCGCLQTKYSSNNYWGGYYETQLSDSVFDVTFRGNNYTKIEKVNDYCLLHCADLTINNGYSYFEVIETPTLNNVNQSKRSYLYSQRTIKLYKLKPISNTNVFEAVYIQKSIKSKYKLK